MTHSNRRFNAFSSSSQCKALFASLGLLVTAGLVPQAAHAQVTFSLTPAAQSGTAGSTVNFSGTITNFSSSAVYLNNIGFSLPPSASPYLTADPTLFFATGGPNLSSPLAANGGSFSGLLFSVAIGNTAPVNTYIGSVSVFGGPGSDTSISTNNAQLASQNFLVNVIMSSGATPEPSAGILAATGLLMTGGIARRRRRS